MYAQTIPAMISMYENLSYDHCAVIKSKFTRPPNTLRNFPFMPACGVLKMLHKSFIFHVHANVAVWQRGAAKACASVTEVMSAAAMKFALQSYRSILK